MNPEQFLQANGFSDYFLKLQERPLGKDVFEYTPPQKHQAEVNNSPLISLFESHEGLLFAFDTESTRFVAVDSEGVATEISQSVQGLLAYLLELQADAGVEVLDLVDSFEFRYEKDFNEHCKTVVSVEDIFTLIKRIDAAEPPATVG